MVCNRGTSGCRCWNSIFCSYSTERQISKNPENFGKGEIKGVAGPGRQIIASAGAFVPMLALGFLVQPQLL